MRWNMPRLPRLADGALIVREVAPLIPLAHADHATFGAAGRRRGLQRVIVGDAAIQAIGRVEPAAAEQAHGQRNEVGKPPDHAPGPKTRQALTATTAAREAGRKTFQPNLSNWA